ncbi:hypothetical protein QQF64_015739 [Cirrhinus molitorella]|uniref:Rho-GAP domain-containing protein n=1 Tax=Cirrhinus molitorella TaxID=172907 RepID=A0ABR3NW58_9TELE
MSTFASQTNMHARNLAIVWAPNLLRSKDIESTGFNGTAAFMEVRVQSIVVEFILTHVPELFPGSGLAVERRKSLPSPQILSSQEDPFFKSFPLQCPGNLSPGDGPPPMRPYHSIIDSTDKRKGSLKGRKWRSIFNLGGRLQDPRKKNKYCPKDKEKTALRPAKSMDSLSSGPYALDDSKHPQAHIPPLVLSTASGSSEGVSSVGGGVSSGYAVTYRRTGGAQVSMVSGGTPGTYNRLESGGGASGAEGASQGVTRSPGMTSKAERRAGIHISGPFSVTVPLHITSGLALGVLHGGWNEKEQPQGDEAEDEDFKSTKMETESTDGNPQSKNDDVQEGERESNSYVESQMDCGKDMSEITRKENDGPEKGDAPSGKEAEEENLSQIEESTEENVENTEPQIKEQPTEEDYMDMRGNHHQEPASPNYYEDMEFPDLPLDFNEAFGFLDSMDSSAANQVEFSVEPFFENEYEEEEDENKDNQAILAYHKTALMTIKQRQPKAAARHDEYSPNDDDEEDDESDKGSEYEDMFCQSLPADRDFQGLSWLSLQATADSSTSNDVDLHTSNQSNALPPENNTDVQSIDQSEDTIPVASALTDSSETAFEPPVSEEHVIKTDEMHVDEKKNEDSKDVEKDKHTLIGDDNPDSEPSEEDTYFGPDSIPPSPEPDQTNTETDSTSLPENIPPLSPAEDAQQVLDADGYHGNCEVPITNELTDADHVSSDPQDQLPEEQTLIINETKTENQTEDEKIEEIEVIVELENEGEVCENNSKTDTDEVMGEDVEEDAKADNENEEQKQVNTTERKEHLQEDSEENAKDGPKEGEQDKNEAERQDDLEEDSLIFEENANDGPEKGEQDKNEAERQDDLEEASGDCEEDANEGLTEVEQDKKAERQDFKENGGDCEENANDELKEGEQDKNKAERLDFKENSEDGEENAKDESKECEEGDEEHAKEGEQEDLKENNEESEKVDEEGEQDKDEDVEGSSEGNSEEDVSVKTESSVEESSASLDDLEKSTSVHQPDEIQQEQAEGEMSVSPVKIPAKPPKRSQRKPANPMKAVPVVPPKPQNSKLTALRKQLQHKQHDEKGVQREVDEEHGMERYVDESVENCKGHADGMRLDTEDPRERRGTWDGGTDRKRDLDREGKRNSGISMCFDEAVARATEKRSRERESTERLSGTQWDRESRKDGKTD